MAAYTFNTSWEEDGDGNFDSWTSGWVGGTPTLFGGDTVTFTNSGSDDSTQISNLTGFTTNTSFTLGSNQTLTILNGVVNIGWRLTETYDYNTQNHLYSVQEAVVVAPNTPTLVSTATTASATTTVTVSSSGGSGGTLQYARSTTNTAPIGSSNWLNTSGVFTGNARGITYYYWARRDPTKVSSSFSYTVPYLSVDSSISVNPSSRTIGNTATSTTFTVSDGSSHSQYRATVNNSSSVSSNTISGNGTLTMSSYLPGAGSISTYETEARRPTDTGGNNSWVDTGDTFTIARQIGTPATPTASSNNAASASVTVTLSAVTVTGGSITYAQSTGTTAPTTGWQTSRTFTQDRNTTRYYWARATSSVNTTTSSYRTLSVGYLLPDTAVTATSSTISNTANSATTTIGSSNAAENYAVRVNNGSSNLATRLGDGSVSFTSSLPTAGSTTTYEIFASRPTDIGGDAGYDATNDTFTVSRQIAVPVTPTVSDDNISGPAVTATVSAVTVTGATISYGQTATNAAPTTWQGGRTFSQPRNSTRYYWVKATSSVNTTVSAGRAHSVGYILPDIAVAATSSTISATATSASTTLSSATASEVYAVRVNNGSSNLATRTSNGSLSFTGSLPSAGTTSTYEIFASRPTSIGGDGAYDATNDTFTVSRQVSAPTGLSASNTNPSSATVSVTLTSSGGLGGTVQYAQTTSNSVPSSGWTTTPTFSQDRGTTRYYWTRRTSTVNTATRATSLSNYVGYIAPDTSVTATSSTISNTASSAATSIGSGNSSETYAIRLNNGSTNLATRTGDGALSFSGSLPSAGTTTTYEIFSLRGTNIGGDGAYDATNDTFTVSRQIATPSTPTVSADNPNTASVTATVGAVSVTGATAIAYAQSTSNTAPSSTSSTWQSSRTFSQPRNTTRYYWVRAVSNVNTTISSSRSLSVGYNAPDSAINNITNQTVSSSTTTTTVSIAGATSIDNYRINNSNTSSSTDYGTRLGNGSVTISGSELPAINSSRTYYVWASRPTASGGSGGYVLTNEFFTITKSAQAPVFTRSAVWQSKNATSGNATITTTPLASGVPTPTYSYSESSSLISISGSTVVWASNNDTTSNRTATVVVTATNAGGSVTDNVTVTQLAGPGVTTNYSWATLSANGGSVSPSGGSLLGTGSTWSVTGTGASINSSTGQLFWSANPGATRSANIYRVVTRNGYSRTLLVGTASQSDAVNVAGNYNYNIGWEEDENDGSNAGWMEGWVGTVPTSFNSGDTITFFNNGDGETTIDAQIGFTDVTDAVVGTNGSVVRTVAPNATSVDWLLKSSGSIPVTNLAFDELPSTPSLVRPGPPSTATAATTAAASVDVTLGAPSVGSGGTLYYARTTVNTATARNAATWQTSNVFTNNDRGSSYYYWAKRVEGTTELPSLTSKTYVIPYLSPDDSITDIASQTRHPTNRATSVAIDQGNSNDVYSARTVNSSTGAEVSTDVNNVISLSSPSLAVNSASASQTYYIWVRKPVNVGGNNSSVPTGISFTLTTQNRAPTANVPTSSTGATAAANETYTVTGTSSDSDDSVQTITTRLQKSTTSSTSGFSTIKTGTTDSKTVTSDNITAPVSATSRNVWYRTQVYDQHETVNSSVLQVNELAAVASTITIVPAGSTSITENTSTTASASTTTASGVSISSYSWSSNNSAISVTNSTSSTATLNFNNVNQNTSVIITCEVTDSLGRVVSDTQSYTVVFTNIAPISSTPTTTNSAPLPTSSYTVSGEGSDVDANGPQDLTLSIKRRPGTSGTYTTVATSTVTGTSTSGTVSYTVSSVPARSSDQIYQYVTEVTDGVSTVVSEIRTVTEKANTAATATISGPTIATEGDDQSFTATVSGLGSGVTLVSSSWSTTYGTVISGGTSGTASIVWDSVSSNTVATITYTGTDSLNRSITDTHQVTISPSTSVDPITESSGGYGFEIYNQNSQVVFRADEVMIRKGVVGTMASGTDVLGVNVLGLDTTSSLGVNFEGLFFENQGKVTFDIGNYVAASRSRSITITKPSDIGAINYTISVRR